MRAAFAVCLVLAAACSGPIGQTSARATPHTLASGGVVEYLVPDPISQGASCFGCGQASLGGIALGADGNIWFVDGGHYRVGRMTLSGAITEFAVPAIVGGPYAITAGPDGNIWVTTNALGQGKQDWILRVKPVPGGLGHRQLRHGT